MAKEKKNNDENQTPDEVNNNQEIQSGNEILLSDGAEYWNFKENEKFVGRYKSIKLDKDEKPMGFVFTEEGGDDVILPNSDAIERAVNSEKIKDLQGKFDIEFLGQITLKKSGLPYNKFKIVFIPD